MLSYRAICRTALTVALAAAWLAAGPASSAGPVVAWGAIFDDLPPDSVDGTTGTATAISAGTYGCAIQAGTGKSSASKR